MEPFNGKNDIEAEEARLESSYQYQKALAERNRRSRRGICCVVAFLAFVIVMYMLFFPLPIYEQIENAKREGVETLDIWGDTEAMKTLHAEMIELTQQMYETRRDEIRRDITNPNSPVGTATRAKCEEILRNEYSGFVMGSINWSLPDAGYTLSAEEADMILYLYSCQFDWDFINGSPENYIKWLYGIDGSTHDYELLAFSDPITLQGRGGYFMDQELLTRGRMEAKRAGREAARQAQLQTLGLTLTSVFTDVAYADDGETWTPDEAYRDAYQASFDAFAATNGSSALDTIIYTNVSDQVSGKISFTVSGSPYYTSGKVKVEEFAGSEAEGVVKAASGDPMHTRAVCLQTSTRSTRDVYRYTIYWYKRPDGTQYSTTGGASSVNDTLISSQAVYDTYENIQRYVIVACYAVTPSVDFTATATINASGIRTAMEGAKGK